MITQTDTTVKSIILIAAMTCLVVTRSFSADLITEIRSKVPDQTKPVTLIVDLPLPPDLAEEFKGVVKLVRARESRTLNYIILREPGTNVITVVETYADVDALADHLAQPYIREFMAKMDTAKVVAKIRVFNGAD